MTKKNVAQIIHDIRPPIEAIHELTSILYEISKQPSHINTHDLEEGLQELSKMTKTLSIYLKERFAELAPKPLAQNPQNLHVALPIAIVLDDDPIITDMLRFINRKNDHCIVVYTSAEKLFSELAQYQNNILFFIDYELGAKKNGLEITKELYEKGYTNLYLMSGHPLDLNDFPHYLHLLSEKKDILYFVNKASSHPT